MRFEGMVPERGFVSHRVAALFCAFMTASDDIGADGSVLAPSPSSRPISACLPVSISRRPGTREQKGKKGSDSEEEESAESFDDADDDSDFAP